MTVLRFQAQAFQLHALFAKCLMSKYPWGWISGLKVNN